MLAKFRKLIATFEAQAFRNEVLAEDQAAGKRVANGIREVVIPKLRELIEQRATSEQCQTMLDELGPLAALIVKPLNEKSDEELRLDNIHWAICSYQGTL